MREKSGVNLCNLWFKDEKAQSMALGFVIIMGILLTASIILLSTELPKQTKKFEAEHAVKVPQDFAEVGSTIDDVALIGGETASATCAIGLTSKSVPFVGVQASGGTLSFDNREKFECLAYVPGESFENGGVFWNCSEFSTCDDKYHVEFPGKCAKLELDAGEDLIFNSGKDEDLSGEFWVNNFVVTNNTTLSCYWLAIHAKNITVSPNSSINATGLGLAGGNTVGGVPWSLPGEGEGRGEIPNCTVDYTNGCLCGAGGGGAGHYSAGGNGGTSETGWGPYCGSSCTNGTVHPGGPGGPVYENVTITSTDMSTTASGSGGACAAWGQVSNGYIYEGGAGGDGGGIIHLDAPTISIIGNVSVDGEKGHYSNDEDRSPGSAGGGGGGGSGGTIILKGDTINISGYLSAKGGDGANGAKACDLSSTYTSNGGGGGGGSGGVIKIFNGTTRSAPGGLANHTNVTGGAGGLGGVGNGTNCDETHHPEPGGNGTAGGDGYVHNESYPGYAESVPHYRTGWLVSKVKDAGYNATGTNTSMICYDNITWTGIYSSASGTGIYMKVRTSTNASMSDAMSWQDCPSVANGAKIADLSSVSNGHRYIQWRADLSTIEKSRTPILQTVNISYNYNRPVIADSTGSLKFETHYFSLPNYKLVYEHGGIIKNQSDSELMLFPPPISISGNPTTLNIRAVTLTCDDTSPIGGVFSTAVKASYINSALLAGGLDYNNISLNFTTVYPTAWQRWFSKTCKEAGLVNGTAPGNYYITGTGTSNLPLSIVFYGNETNPVHLWLKESEVGVEVAG